MCKKRAGPEVQESHNELTRKNLKCNKQKDIPVDYRGVRLHVGFRADIFALSALPRAAGALRFRRIHLDEKPQ